MKTYLDYPMLPPPSTGVNFALTATTHKLAGIGRVTRSGSIDRVVFRAGTVTTSQPVRVSLQDVDTSTGEADGFADQSGVQSSLSSSTNYIVNLESARSVSVNDLLAVVCEFDGTAGNLNIIGIGANGSNLGYLSHFTTSWAKQTSRAPMFALGYSDGVYAPVLGWYPPALSTLSYNSGSSIDEYALYLVCPEQLVVVGMTVAGQWTANVEFVLYDSAGAELRVVTVSSTVVLNQASYGRALFSSPITLRAGQVYRCAVRPTTASNITLHYVLAPNNAVLGATFWGTDAYLSSRTDAGAWTQNTSLQPCISLIVDRDIIPMGQSRGRVVNR